MQALMQTSYGSSDLAAQVIAISSHRDSKPEPVSFSNNNDHLQALEYESKLMVAVATLRCGTNNPEESAVDKESRFLFLPSGADLFKAAELLEIVTVQNRAREAVSLKQGIKLNFIEFCNSWELDNVERKIVMLLLMQFSSPGFYSTYLSSGLERSCDNGMEIGAVLTIISEHLGEQLENRRYFNIYGSLLGKEILNSNHNFIDSTTSILRMSVYLHERYVRHILGDENQYHVAFRFIRQERSNVNLAQVVLPDDLKSDVVERAEQYLAGRKDGTLEQLDEFFGYGTGMAFLFHGPSGTGKTMLAKGIANHLDSPLISLNLEDMPKINVSDDEILAMLFREAALLNGIVFLDECDDVFGRSETRLSRSLLLEIEKSRCITILATNKPLELDPAMERRIAMKVRFELPDATLRRRMWQALLPPAAAWSEDVGLALLAERFQFSGGLIKNCILMALTSAQASDSSKTILTQAALERTATLQTATISDISRLCEKLTPVKTLDAVPVGYAQRDQLRGLARAWEWLRNEKTGFNLLFNCIDITTGIKAACGLAGEIGMDVQAFDITKVSSVADDDKVLDLITQRRIYPMAAAFLNSGSGRFMTLFIDYQGDVAKLIDSGYDKATNLMYGEMFHQLRKNSGLFCLVTKDVKTGNVPVEFHQMVTLAHPPEEMQLKQWEANLGAGSLCDDDLVDLVERYPMHLPEIEFIARQARVRGIIAGRDRAEIGDVTEVITGYRGSKKAGVLFGGR
jgi:hypothetical protein